MKHTRTILIAALVTVSMLCLAAATIDFPANVFRYRTGATVTFDSSAKVQDEQLQRTWQFTTASNASECVMSLGHITNMVRAGMLTASADKSVSNTFSPAFASVPAVLVSSVGAGETALLVSISKTNFVASTTTAGSNITWIAFGR